MDVDSYEWINGKLGLDHHRWILLQLLGESGMK
jgi:hypothetical protein